MFKVLHKNGGGQFMSAKLMEQYKYGYSFIFLR